MCYTNSPLCYSNSLCLCVTLIHCCVTLIHCVCYANSPLCYSNSLCLCVMLIHRCVTLIHRVCVLQSGDRGKRVAPLQTAVRTEHPDGGRDVQRPVHARHPADPAAAQGDRAHPLQIPELPGRPLGHATGESAGSGVTRGRGCG